MEKKRRALKIKTGSCRRLAVDIKNYTQETVDFQEKIHRAREEVRVMVVVVVMVITVVVVVVMLSMLFAMLM
jgi:hypothetical protein